MNFIVQIEITRPNLKDEKFIISLLYTLANNMIFGQFRTGKYQKHQKYIKLI